METSLALLDLLGWEEFLNRYSGKRYHLGLSERKEDFGFYLIESIDMMTKKMLINCLTEDQMKLWLMKHLKVELKK